MIIEMAERLKKLPPYLFVEIDRRKRQLIADGHDVIALGIGDPDLPTPKFIIDRMAKAIYDPANHQYPLQWGVLQFRQQAARWLQKRFALDFDPQTEILTLIGTKEGIAHLPLAVVNPGDVVLVPEPGYPVYQAASMFAGAEIHRMPLLAANGFLPDLDAIPAAVRKRARMMYLNYPNNPTAAVANRDFFERVVAFAHQHNIIIAQDAAYAEVYFDEPPLSLLQIDGARDVAIEFHSLSKTFNMTGWRLAFAIGNKDLIAALAKVKENADSGQFNAIQWAGVEALSNANHPDVKGRLEVYRKRRDVMVAGLRAAGIEVNTPSATFYLWAKCPGGLKSMDFVSTVMDKARVVVTPGIGFGPSGDDYFRAALTVDVARIREAVERIGKLTW